MNALAPRIPASAYRERDTALLRHVAGYGVLLGAVAARLFFDGKPCGHAIRKLTEEGAIKTYQRAIPGGISYSRLSAASCHRLGIPETHAAEIKGTVLDAAIALVCYCCLDTHRRYRLTRADFVSAVGKNDAPPSNVFHVLTTPEEAGQSRILRVLVATGSVGQTMKQLKRYTESATLSKTFVRWLGPEGEYGFCVLAPSQRAIQAISAAIDRSGLRESFYVHVGWGPSAQSLAQYLRQAHDKKGDS